MTNKVSTFFYDRHIPITVLEGCRINTPMYRSHINIFHGVNNRLDFTLKDSDRKAVKLLQSNLRAYVINPQNDELMLERTAVITDEKKGLYTVFLYPNDIIDWSEGFYNLSVILSDIEGGDQFVFFDHAQQSVGTLELINTPYPRHRPSFETSGDQFTPNQGVFYSSRFAGNSTMNYLDSIQTTSVQIDDFFGTFAIEASLEPYASQNEDYFELYSMEFDEPTSGTYYFNTDGNYTWFRFKYTPHADNTGTITKILFRN